MTQVISIILELYNNNSRKIARSIERIMATELFEKIPFSLSYLQHESVADIEAFGAARIYEVALAMLDRLYNYQERNETPPLDALLINDLFSNQRHFAYMAKDVEIFTATLQEIIKLEYSAQKHESEIDESDKTESTPPIGAGYKSLIELLHDAAFWILIKLSQPKYVRRRFKQLIRHEIAWEASENKMVGGKSGTKYASTQLVEFQKKLEAHRDAWLEGKFINHRGKKISLATISRNRKQTYAAVACKAYGLIDIAKHKKYECMLITVTCPPHLHTNPTKGTSRWEKGNLELAPAYLSSGWEKFGKELSRLSLEPSKHRVFGLRTTELHADGTPHWHITFYYPPRSATKIKRLFTRGC